MGGMRFLPPWGGAFGLQTHVKSTPNALPADEVEAIRQAILTSPFLASTQLTGGFSGTYGFSLTFRRSNLHEVAATFPDFVPFLIAAIQPGCNAFILNPLVVQAGRNVGAHVDCSFAGYSETVGCPALVSVLYVQIPADLQGGRLKLYRQGREVASVTPAPHTLLHFRGDLLHEVTAVLGEAPSLETARISLVVEQYRLSDPDLAKVPAFAFHSTALAGLRA